MVLAEGEENGPATGTWADGDGSGGLREALGMGLPAPASDTFRPPSLSPRFRLERILGAGGQAEVWLAFDRELSESVAVKLFRPGLDEVSRERLRREVRLGRTLAHPRLVRMFELVESDGRLGVVMEWIPGGTLADRLRIGPLPVDDVIRVADESLEALEVLHDRGVIHRDVKPSNLLLGADGSVRLSDFGLVRPVESGSALTVSSQAVGTPGYMSPEQLQCKEVGPAADLYSLGVTLFHLLAGRPPFAGESSYDVAIGHLTRRPPDPASLRSDCPRWLSRFVLRLLEKRPEDRFPGAPEARAALESRAGVLSPRARRRRFALGAALFLGCGLLGALWLVAKPFLLPSRAVKAFAEGSVVRGIGPSGETVFEERFPSPPSQVLQADLKGTGEADTIVVWVPPLVPESMKTPSEVRIVDAKGRRAASVRPEELILTWPFESSKALIPVASVIDVDGDGTKEVVLNARHRVFYPSALLIYWTGNGSWEPVLLHSGNIDEVAAAPERGRGRLRFRARNNRLGFLSVEGEIEVTPPAGDAMGVQAPVVISPGIVTTDQFLDDRVRLTRYVLVGESWVTASERTLRVDAGTISRSRGGRVSLDRFGNVVPGPNAGRDLASERVRFLHGISSLFGESRGATARSVEKALSRISLGAGPLLSERAYRGILDLFGARALAAAGDVDGARARLLTALAGDPIAEVRYRAAQMELASGNLEEGLIIAESLVAGQVSARAGYDGVLLLVRAAAERGDRERARSAALDFVARFKDGKPGTEMDALLARTRLLWDELADTDVDIRSSNLIPEGDAIGCLARWRLGRSRPDDSERMTRLAEEAPEAALEALAARAAALISAGRARDAAGELNRLIARLEPRARDDFGDRQTLDLARGLYAEALLASGDAKRARREAASARPALRPGLLPRILVEEVLREAGAGGSTRADSLVPLARTLRARPRKD